MKPADLERQVVIGQVALDPAGELVAYTRRSVVDGRDRVDLWTVPYEGGEERPLTDGPSLDTCPRFSPDGASLAYLSGRPGEDWQVWVMRRDGGDPRRVTDFPHGAVDIAWLPAGDALVVLAEDRHRPGEVLAGEEEEPTARVIDRIDWRSDAEGTDMRRPHHLHRAPLEGGAPERLTEGAWSASRPRVTSDGRVLYLADKRPDADLFPARQVYEAGGAVLTALAGGVYRYAIEDDDTIFLLGYAKPRRRDFDPPQPFRLRPGRELEPVSGELDRYAGEFAWSTDLHDWCSELDDAGPVTGLAGSACIVPTRIADGAPEPLVDPDLLPLSGSIAAAGGRVVAALTLGAGVRAPELHALEAGEPRRLTHMGSAWLEELELPAVEVVEIEGQAGPMTTVLLRPAAAGPSATVLIPHGGPTEQWGVVPTLEAVLLASAGYLLALPNIRGSFDRGSDWVAALGGRWGERDAADCHAILDHLVAAGLADPARLGVSGLSYGGFLANWLIASSDRFAAAVSENGVVNQVASWANCDLGPLLNHLAGLADPTTPEGAEKLWQMSPLRHVANIHTPLLILQAEDDVLCPPADNEQLFVALRWLGREVEHVRYPEEHHNFQGDGRFDRRVDRHTRVLEWFGRHMPA